MQQRQVGAYHFADKVFEGDFGRPAQQAPGFTGVAAQFDCLAAAGRIELKGDVIAKIQPGGLERDAAEVGDAVGDPGGDDEVFGTVLLQHAVHGTHMIAGMAPVAPMVGVAQLERFSGPRGYASHAEGDFAGDELRRPQGAFVVVKDRSAGEYVVLGAVGLQHVQGVGFGCAVGVGWSWWGVLVLGRDDAAGEDLAAEGLAQA